MTSNGKLIYFCFNSSAQGFMVKTTQKSDLPWSAIFIVIVYALSLVVDVFLLINGYAFEIDNVISFLVIFVNLTKFE